MEKVFDFGVDLMLPMFSSTILKAIDDLQLQQQPPYSNGIYQIEIRKEVIKHSGVFFSKLFPIVIDPVFANLLRSDTFYANEDCTKFSMIQIDENYQKYSDQINKVYPGYSYDDKFLIKNEDDVEVDIDELKQFFLSKELDRYEELQQKFIGVQTRFLKQHDGLGVTYTSFPRSGNTFLRKYFETITGIATGSDMVMKFSLNVALQFAGFKGEGIVDNRIWINKSHFPYRFPYDHPYETQVVLCCVRNPLDVFVSQLLQLCTMCHNQDINEDFTKYSEWELHVQQEVHIWKKWHNYWIQKAREQEIPILFFRFEDLLKDPKDTLSEIFGFALGQQSIEGTIVERRILEAIQQGQNGNTLYKPRSGGINKNKDKYTEQQMNYIMDNLEEHLNFWGYTDVPGKNNEFGFFDYKEKANQEYTQQFEGFKQMNEQSWKNLLKSSQKVKNARLEINKPGEGLSMFKEKQIHKYLPLPSKSTIREKK